MGDHHKVLAVSYGNFSCRLEGFDDSVDVMKSVVSYFHDLAGHDRFMDMELQAPDLETLARLTEEQTGAPVIAEGEGQNVSLRPADADADEMAEDTLADDLAADDQDDWDGDAADAWEDDADVAFDDDDADDQAAEVMSDDDDIAETGYQMPTAHAADATADADDDFDIAESVAAKLQRIRAVVGRVAPPETPDTYAEDLNETAEEDAIEIGLREAAHEFAEIEEDDLAEDDVAENLETEHAAAVDSDEDDIMAEVDEEILADTTIEDEIEADAAYFAETDTDETELDPTTADLADDDMDAVAGMDDMDVVASVDEMDHDDTFADVAESHDEVIVDDFHFHKPAAPERPAPYLLSGRSEQDEPDIDDLTDEEIAEFEAEDAELHTDDLDDDDAAEQDEVAEAPYESPLRRRNPSKRSNLPDHDDDALSRIMSQADEHLREPQSQRHRDAFAQLRAAVAATEAARQLGDDGDATDPKEAFREDLDAENRRDADVDQPAVVADDAPPPAASSPAPLKLVASQRVDIPSKSVLRLEPTAMRLRQIAAVKESESSTRSGFTEFAKSHAATELGELLEAAAAYISFIEGEEDFSRPQVMKKVQTVTGDEISREDGLRSFGRLLRQGKIAKLENGRFQVADDTRFRPGSKAAQG